MLARGAFFNTLAFLASNLRGIFTFLVARILGSAALGAFGIAWATTDLVSKLGTLGLDGGAIGAVARREAANDPAGSRRIMRAALLLGLTASGIVAIAGFAVAWTISRRSALRPEVPRATAIMLLALPGLALYRISNALSRGKGAMHHDIFSRGLTESLGTAAALGLALGLGARTFAPELAAIAGTLASGAVAFWFACRVFRLAPRSASPPGEISALVRHSAPIALYDLLNIGIMRVDVIMLGLFVGRAAGVTVETLGIYAAAVEVAGGLRKVSQAFNPIFAPTVARQMSAGRLRDAEASYGYLARWMLGLLLPAVAVLALSGDAIMMIYGPVFARGGPWVAIVGVGCALNAYFGLGEMILMVERPQVNLMNSAVALLASIGLNLVLIPKFGALGAAMGMLVPYTIQGILRGVEITWLFHWRWPWRALARPAIAAVAALPIAVLVRLTGSGALMHLLAGAGYLAGYLIAWRVLGLEQSDRAVLDRLFHRRGEPLDGTA